MIRVELNTVVARPIEDVFGRLTDLSGYSRWMPKLGVFGRSNQTWFYVLKGDFAFEIGEEQYALSPGDSLLAPRMVPHVWAYVGEEPGTLLVALQPAGSFEAFVRESCQMRRLPTPEEADRMFAAHGMKVVGPPLDVD